MFAVFARCAGVGMAPARASGEVLLAWFAVHPCLFETTDRVVQIFSANHLLLRFTAQTQPKSAGYVVGSTMGGPLGSSKEVEKWW